MMGTRNIILYFTGIACLLNVSLQGEEQRRLYRDLMISYNLLERPVLEESQSVTVQLGLHLLQIVDVDEKNQVLTTNAWLDLSWKDYNLQWNTTDYPGVEYVRFPDNRIWKPDILLYNSADERFDATFHPNVLVNFSGHCHYVTPGIFKSTCYIDMRWFPFDVQREWDLVEVLGRRNEKIYACCEEPYPDVTFTVVMRRRALYYGLTLLLPCVLISMLAMLVFLLPADSGEKISLGITVLLSLTVFMLLVAEIMPKTSDSVPILAQYFATIMVIVGLSIIATVLVLQYHHHDPDGSKMPKWMQVILLDWCARFLRMRRPGEQRVRPVGDNKQPLASLSCMHLTSGAGEEEAPLYAGGGDHDMGRILEEVRYIALRFRDQDRSKAACSEWKFAAAVVDRLCLVVFSIITILCTVGILMSAKFMEATSKDFSA
ncbi:hypothetical protein AAFF_G00299950 [Aldrovandia affinis]|uniref:Neuronal acetylcholine receptor subunit alpha-7-like n=1 Tax=Aldrovandia affinis TaxID=143900 RepID=A0AAD7WR70_9TELE|nr:hypothetical protein AAFF_G00299950 [Aldrovandia affinis]